MDCAPCGPMHSLKLHYTHCTFHTSEDLHAPPGCKSTEAAEPECKRRALETLPLSQEWMTVPHNHTCQEECRRQEDKRLQDWPDLCHTHAEFAAPILRLLIYGILRSWLRYKVFFTNKEDY